MHMYIASQGAPAFLDDAQGEASPGSLLGGTQRLVPFVYLQGECDSEYLINVGQDKFASTELSARGSNGFVSTSTLTKCAWLEMASQSTYVARTDEKSKMIKD